MTHLTLHNLVFHLSWAEEIMHSLSCELLYYEITEEGNMTVELLWMWLGSVTRIHQRPGEQRLFSPWAPLNRWFPNLGGKHITWHPGGGKWSSGCVFRPRITIADDESKLAAGRVREGDRHTEAWIWRLLFTSAPIMQKSRLETTGLFLKTFSSERLLQFRTSLRWPGPTRTFTDSNQNQSINQSFKGVSKSSLYI